MEHSIHRQLKSLYVTDTDQHEVTIDGFRIDAVDEERLIEIQYGSLGAIRDKIRRLLRSHDVLVVKPTRAGGIRASQAIMALAAMAVTRPR